MNAVYERPIIIVFEGLDCCYKETNSKALKKYLMDKGYEVSLKHFPRYKSEAAYFVKLYLKGFYKEACFFNDPHYRYGKSLDLISSFYMLDMFDWNYKFFLCNKGFKPDDKKRIIIFDRWFYSMMYYLTKDINLNFDDVRIRQVYSKQVYLDAVYKYHLPKADILIKMINNDMDTIELISKNRKGPQDIYESDVKFLSRVRENYNTMDFKRFVSERFDDPILNVNVEHKDRDQVFNEIIQSKEIKQIDTDNFNF